MKWIGITSAVVAATMGAFAWLLYREVRAISSWPTVAGVVVASELQHTLVDSSTRRRHLALVPNVRYEFEVDGRTFSGTRISNRKYNQYVSTMTAPAGKELRRLLERYTRGANVTVHYNPERPASAVLEIDRTGAVLCATIAAAAALVSIVSFSLSSFGGNRLTR